MFTRRNFIAVGAMAGLSACATTPPPIPATVPSPPVIPPLPDFYGAITTEPYPIPAIPEGKLPQRYWRQEVAHPWPRWKVPQTMIARKPELEPYSVANGGMDPGPENPLGARALYLFQNGIDTLYRIHGDASYLELGKAVSSGCIRMLNQDVIHLHERAIHGSSVIVLPSMKANKLEQLY